MEALGLTMTDLLNVDNMTQLVLAIEGEDMISLMTDEGLYNSLQNLLSMVYLGTSLYTIGTLERHILLSGGFAESIGKISR